jgi:hypothetical protein
MNHQQILHDFLLEDRAALCATLMAKTVDLAVFRQRREENPLRRSLRSKVVREVITMLN